MSKLEELCEEYKELLRKADQKALEITRNRGLVGNCALCGKHRIDLYLHSVVNGEPQYLGLCCRPKS